MIWFPWARPWSFPEEMTYVISDHTVGEMTAFIFMLMLMLMLIHINVHVYSIIAPSYVQNLKAVI